MRPESFRSKPFIDCSKWECWNCGAIHHYIPADCQKCRVKFVSRPHWGVPEKNSEISEEKKTSISFDELISDLLKGPEEE